jgi:hypothetical protein
MMDRRLFKLAAQSATSGLVSTASTWTVQRRRVVSACKNSIVRTSEHLEFQLSSPKRFQDLEKAS